LDSEFAGGLSASAWRLEQPMRRLFLKTDEKWPLFKDTSVDVAA
jgi:hypothetical protein